MGNPTTDYVIPKKPPTTPAPSTSGQSSSRNQATRGKGGGNQGAGRSHHRGKGKATTYGSHKGTSSTQGSDARRGNQGRGQGQNPPRQNRASTAPHPQDRGNYAKHQSGEKAGPLSLKEQKRLLFKTGGCFVCGKAGHKAVDCTAKGVPPAAASATQGTSYKRPREPLATPPPPAKRQQYQGASSAPRQETVTSGSSQAGSSMTGEPAKKRFQYAEVAKGASEVVVRRTDGSHISKSEWTKLLDSFMLDMDARLDTTGWTPDVTSYSYSIKKASFFAEDTATTTYLKQLIQVAGLQAANPETETTATAPPLKIMSGFVPAPQGHQPRDRIERAVLRKANEMRIPGKVAISSITQTTRGCILRLSFDTEAAQVFAEKDNKMIVGAGGMVLFQDVKDPKMSLDNRSAIAQAKVTSLENELAEQKALVARLERAKDDEVRSLGISSMELNEGDVTVSHETGMDEHDQ